MEIRDIKKYFEFLGHKKQTELRFIKPAWKDGNKKPIQEWCSNFGQIQHLIEKYNGEYNLYTGLNERIPAGDKDDDVKFITNVGHDIDVHNDNPDNMIVGKKIAEQIKEDSIKKGYSEPLIMCSGRGYWVIHKTEPIENNEENRKKIKAFGLAVKKIYEKDGVDIDTTVYNPSRIARIPGTINISDKDNFVKSYLINSPEIKEDKKFREYILNLKIEESYPKTIIQYRDDNKESDCYFMDYCLTHEIPTGERHKVISRNMSIYISNNPDRKLLEEQYYKIQKGSNNELVNWLKSIDTNPNKKFPFSCGELINFQKKYGIPLKCLNCPKYKIYQRELKAEKNLQKAIEIENKKDYSKLQKETLTCIALKDYNNASELIVKEIEENNFIYTTKNDVKSEMWIYEEGVYKPNGKAYIKEFSRSILGETYNTYIANLIISKIETDTYIKEEDFFINDNVNELPVQNGILNVITRELLDFDPKKIFFNKLQVEYDEDATCESIDTFLGDILTKEEDIVVAYEIIGSGLMKEYFTEKAAMLVGEGRNGKSKFLELIKRLSGIENTCSVPIRSMREDNSSLCELHGKLFNLAGDLSGGDLKDTGVFKQTVGRDILQAHRKFLTDLKFVNYAKHIFACNDLPRVYDTTDGFWDKWILLKFPYKFITKEEKDKLPENEQINKKIKDQYIVDKISTPEELSGLLNKSLDGLSRLLEKSNFSQTEGSTEIKDYWIRNSDSFVAFCIDNIEESYNSYIPKKQIRNLFSKYCKKHKVKGAGDKSIKATLEDRYGAYSGAKNVNNEYEHVWEGIKFK